MTHSTVKLKEYPIVFFKLIEPFQSLTRKLPRFPFSLQYQTLKLIVLFKCFNTLLSIPECTKLDDYTNSGIVAVK